MAIPSAGMPAEAATSLIQALLCEDLDPNLNLATFSTTTLDDLPIDLICDTLRKNMSNQHEYVGISRQRCAGILASLWHGGNNAEKPIGTATTGSSEAVMLGCLAMKKQWATKARKTGADTSHPNIIFSSVAHVVCAKFAQYFDVEARVVPVTSTSGYVMDPEAMVQFVDENTIGVVAVLGSTYTGHYEPIRRIASALDELSSGTGMDIPIHVDAASGGFVAPFVQPDLIWDFQLERVHSINVSSHKFGQVPTSLGWVVWRDVECIPKDLIFDVDYLDQVYQSWTLSFSKPSVQVVLQYYNFIKNGFDGTANIMQKCIRRAQKLSIMLEETRRFTCISNIHNNNNKRREEDSHADQFHTHGSINGNNCNGNERNGIGAGNHASPDNSALPVVAFAFSSSFQTAKPLARLDVLSEQLRRLGYSVPCCKLSLLSGSVDILRIVVRPDIDDYIIERLVSDIDHCIQEDPPTSP